MDPFVEQQEDEDCLMQLADRVEDRVIALITAMNALRTGHRKKSLDALEVANYQLEKYGLKLIENKEDKLKQVRCPVCNVYYQIYIGDSK